MAINSTIEWTESTWNPLTGCSKISPGCKHCYAERMADRLQAMGQSNYRNGFKLTLQPQSLEYPMKWKKPQVIFVNSMSDIFHKDVPSEYVLKIFKVMNSAHWHTFQVLTKRPERLSEFEGRICWTRNIWMGTTIETADYKFRADHLRKCGAKIKFLSLEPLLGPLGRLDLSHIDWAIVGGESGPGARPMEIDWVLDIKNQCKKNKVSFFFKQWGGVWKKRTGRELEGRTWDEMPVIHSNYQDNRALVT